MLEAAETIGGGTRTGELTVPGVLHDHCSAVHPMAVGSPFLNSLGLERHGLEWLWPEVDLAHPLDDGTAGVMVQSMNDTVEGLGQDGAAWRRIFGSSAANFEALNDDLFRPVLHVPSHPIRLVRFGLAAAAPASVLQRIFKTPQAKALFGGVAAHAIGNLGLPMSSSVGTALICACHAFGWAVAKGGSASITTALAGRARRARGEGRDRRHGALAGRAARRRRRRLRPRPARRRRHRGGPPARRVSPAPIAATSSAPGRSRSTSRSKAGSRGRTRPPAAPAPCTPRAPSRSSPRPTAMSPEGGCPSGPTSSSPSSTWPTPRARTATSTRSGPTPTCRTASRATRPRS